MRVVTGHEACPDYEEELQDMDTIVKLTKGLGETTTAEVEKPVMKSYDQIGMIQRGHESMNFHGS